MNFDFAISRADVTCTCAMQEDGWMDDLRFYVLLTVFQSYQDDVWMMMKGYVQWNSVCG